MSFLQLKRTKAKEYLFMASSVTTAYALIKTLLNRKKISIRHLAVEVGANKDTVHNHVQEMQSQGLVEITQGKYGGVIWVVSDNSTYKDLFQNRLQKLLETLQGSLVCTICIDSISDVVYDAITDVQEILEFFEVA